MTRGRRRNLWRTGCRPWRRWGCLAVALVLVVAVASGSTPALAAGAFRDVTAQTAHEKDIAWLADEGISTGWARADGTREFRPNAQIARGDMAAFLYRLAGSPSYTAPSRSPFADVAPKTAHYKEICWLAATGVSEGWKGADGTRTFRPYESVARGDMAAFLHRLGKVVAPATSAGGMTVAEALAQVDAGTGGFEAASVLAEAARAAGAKQDYVPVKVEGRWVNYGGGVLDEKSGRSWEAAQSQGVGLAVSGRPTGLYVTTYGQAVSERVTLGWWASPRYTYTPYLLRNDVSGTTLYSGMKALVYLRTDNTRANGDPSLSLYDKTYHRWVETGASGWDDVPGAASHSGWEDSEYTVDGGILLPVSLYYSSEGDDGKYVQLPMEAGRHEIVVYEHWIVKHTEPDEDGIYRYDYYYATVGSFTLDVTDYDQAESAWMQAVLDACTTASMNPLEKMQAVETYLKGDGQYAGFTYVLNSPSGKGLSLAKRGSSVSPYFVSRRWDSYTSPAVLCEFANLIGGFDDVHNCYYDYTVGTSGWYQTHYYCRVTYQGEQHWFYVCPSSSTGRVDSFDNVSFAQGSGDLVALS